MSTDTLTRHGWVRRGLVWHNPAAEANRPTAEAEARIEYQHRVEQSARQSSTCIDCPTRIQSRFKRCRDCWKSHLAENRTPNPIVLTDVEQVTATLDRTLQFPRPISQWDGCCPDCDCVLLPRERCPGCLAWAERDAIRTSWRRPMEMAA